MTSLKSVLIAGVGAAAMLVAGAASATEIFHPGDPEFNVTFHTDGSISASFGVHGILGPTFDHIYEFTIPSGNDGLGSGSVTTTATRLNISTTTFLDSVTVNGVLATESHTEGSDGSWIQTWSTASFPITVGELNQIQIQGHTYITNGNANGSYGGQATFTPTDVPEPATWAMLILGFGLVGLSRRHRKAGKVHA